MTLNDGFDRTVSSWLDEQAGRSATDYLDETLALTSRTRQRPAWSSLERWLPVQATLRLAPVPRIAWLLVVLALVLALVVAVLAVGARQHRPAPLFGLARNGAILYGSYHAASGDNDVYTLDPATGATKPLLTGSTNDHDPSLSRDGTRFVFLRDSTIDDAVIGGYEPMLMVANADGSDVRTVTDALANLGWVEWSSDGARVAIAADIDSKPVLRIFTLDGSTAPRAIDIGGMAATFVQFRPGDQELVFRGTTGNVSGVYAMGIDGSRLRPILPPTADSTLDHPALSPDGSKLAYQKWETDHGVIHVIGVDAGVDRIPAFEGVPGDLGPVWSPDGTRLAFERVAGGFYQIATALAFGGPVVDIGPAMPVLTGDAVYQFSPDGTKVIVFYPADRSTWMLDVAGGPGVQLPATAGATSWQRLAP
jgi:hypothetical protein